MKSILKGITLLLLIISFISCKEELKKEVKQSFTEHSPTAHHKIALEILKASKNWITNFNKGKVDACINKYDKNAMMRAMPFGLKKGKKEISEFWKPFIKSGATNLIYTNVSIEVVNETTAFLSANWSMNIGRGIIYQEKWEKKNEVWVLTYDDFKVLEQFKEPKENITNPVASHITLEEVIKASIKFTNAFNSGKGEMCGNGYLENGTLNAIPFAVINGKKEIEDFWRKLIKDGATNLIYHNPTFKVTTDTSVFLASQWSMNIGEGKIYQEKWEKINGVWLLSYDEFKVLKQY